MDTERPVSGDRAGPARMAIGRIRIRSLARVGFSIGWVVSLLPAVLISAVTIWILHGIWHTLDGWTPWTPWSPDAHIGPFALPAPPAFAPLEALHVERFYHLLAPVGQHPIIAAALGALALTAIGGGLVALTMILTGLAYNLFARLTGGIEFELRPRPPRRHRPSPRSSVGRARRSQQDDDWAWGEEEGASLRW